jgi:Flp pilus assembly protein TadD
MERPYAYSEVSRREHLRGLILLAEERNTSALRALRIAAENSPRDFFYYGREYASALLRAGRTDEALAECERLSKFNENDPVLMMIRCKAEMIDGRIDSARSSHDRILGVLSGADEDYRPLVDFRDEYEKLAAM